MIRIVRTKTLKALDRAVIELHDQRNAARREAHVLRRGCENALIKIYEHIADEDIETIRGLRRELAEVRQAAAEAEQRVAELRATAEDLRKPASAVLTPASKPELEAKKADVRSGVTALRAIRLIQDQVDPSPYEHDGSLTASYRYPHDSSEPAIVGEHCGAGRCEACTEGLTALTDASVAAAFSAALFFFNSAGATALYDEAARRTDQGNDVLAQLDRVTPLIIGIRDTTTQDAEATWH
ncbi:hypothetical protein M1P56_35950 (plasmid) [Streptomyces sp. HU2014]|uniref:hypothetical protein n=1 Tax=Streptomyces sp. HU2014 TaxID=2939414 RepID=UPI00200DB315|nr:hypothetical protein [Streptomyces sp. HU2014]UQI49798.1 hypothetical protein M1P56_35950 [Streptomyces sp. HU2014]